MYTTLKHVPTPLQPSNGQISPYLFQQSRPQPTQQYASNPHPYRHRTSPMTTAQTKNTISSSPASGDEQRSGGRKSDTDAAKSPFSLLSSQRVMSTIASSNQTASAQRNGRIDTSTLL
jgi:hypothetical protein